MSYDLSDPRQRRVVATLLHLARRRPPHPLRSVDRRGTWRSVGRAFKESRRTVANG